jgi:hypothetical protein
MWTGNRSRTDRILAAVEIPALGVWIGALAGFAFIFAPAAFRILGGSDVAHFAALTAAVLGKLAPFGYICGSIAIVVALVRSREAGERTYDFTRALFILVALGLVFFQSATIIPAMAATTDFHSDAYHALHARSSAIYGAAMLLGLIALVMAAARKDS